MLLEMRTWTLNTLDEQVGYLEGSYQNYLLVPYEHNPYISLIITFWGNCVSALIFNPNCDFTSIFVDFAVLPLLFTNEAAFYPYF